MAPSSNDGAIESDARAFVNLFDREIAQALAVLQVAVIVGTFVLIELYDAIDAI